MAWILVGRADVRKLRFLFSDAVTLKVPESAHDRIVQVARTIADLAGREQIESSDVAEAVQYRALDRAYFQ